jgi:hypothetical protein
MGAPIAVELVASLPASDEAAQALLAACSAAAGPGGCVLTGAEPAPEARARAVVEFAEGYARVRVETSLPPAAGAHGPGRSATREAMFRQQDPLVERFRAAGLIVAGLVSDLTPNRPRTPELSPPAAPPPSPSPSPPPPSIEIAPSPATSSEPLPAPPRTRDWAVALSLAGYGGVSSVRPRLGAALTADAAFRPSRVFLTTSASYEQAVTRDSTGISDARGRVGAGLGGYVPIAGPALSLLGRAIIEVEDLRVSVDQPRTGRYDAASRVLPGFALEGEVVWSFGGVAAFVDVRLAWADAQVDVSVAGQPTTVVSPWAAGAGLGLAVEFR